MANPKEIPEILKFGSKLTGGTARTKERQRRKAKVVKWLMSAVLSIVSFVLLSLFAGVTLYLNSPDGWLDYVKNDYLSVVYMEACFFFTYLVLFCYYAFEKHTSEFTVKDAVCILLLLFIGIVISYFTGRYIHVFARPVLLTSLLYCFLRDKRESIFMTFVYSMLVFIMDYFTNFEGVGMNFEIFTSFILSFSCGMFAIFLSGVIKTRIKMLAIGLLLLIPTELVLGMFWLSQGETFYSYAFVEILVYGAVAMLLSVLLFLFLLPIFEGIFSKLTVFRLRELTSFDVKLLKRLREEAPATFDHSMVVAQFAESCAANIGANAELARAAAYYHDVGKLMSPAYFTENQNRGNNPHDYLPPEVSVEVIRAHTVQGKELIQKNHLPDYFGEVAFRHHGTMPIRFFYVKAKTMADGEEVDIRDYSYQDSKPLDKITAIVMICDACEAAIRSFRDNVTRQRRGGGEVTPESITKGIETIIKKIVDERIELDQFSECDITMKELGTISTSILNCSTGVYHGRVAYPELNLKRRR